MMRYQNTSEYLQLNINKYKPTFVHTPYHVDLFLLSLFLLSNFFLPSFLLSWIHFFLSPFFFFGLWEPKVVLILPDGTYSFKRLLPAVNKDACPAEKKIFIIALWYSLQTKRRKPIQLIPLSFWSLFCLI